MERQQKITNFMKSSGSAAQIYDSSDLKIQDQDNSKPKIEKKQPMLIPFLEKFNQSEIEVMQEYIETNRYLLGALRKNKVILFEDVFLILEFRRELAELKAYRANKVDALIDKLHPILNRSKVTIRERIMKKLPHCSVGQIMNAIKNKKDLIIEKNPQKRQQFNQIFSKSNESVDNTSSKREISQPRDLGEQKKEHPNIQVQAELPNRPEIAARSSNVNNTSNRRLYRQGTKPIHQKIYFYANKETRQLFPFTQSTFNEMKARYQVETTNMPNIAQNKQPVQIEEDIQNAQRIQVALARGMQLNDITTMSQTQREDFLNGIKEKIYQVLNNPSLIQGNENEAHKQMMKQLKALDQAQAKLSLSKNHQPSQKEKTEILNIGQKPQEKFESKGNNMIEEGKDIDKTKQEKKTLFKLSNNKNYLELVNQDPDLWLKYGWQDEEDHILYSFKFNPKAYRTEMICLLKYKGRDMVLERMKFLHFDLSWSLLEQVNDLERKKPQPTKHYESPSQEMMDIQ